MFFYLTQLKSTRSKYHVARHLRRKQIFQWALRVHKVNTKKSYNINIKDVGRANKYNWSAFRWEHVLTIGESKFDEPNESFYKGILDASRDGACERTLQKVKSATVVHVTRYLWPALLRPAQLQLDWKYFAIVNLYVSNGTKASSMKKVMPHMRVCHSDLYWWANIQQK